MSMRDLQRQIDEEGTAPGRRLTGRMVLLCLVGFFGVVFGVNGILIHEALSTFGGVDTDSAYQAGRMFEHDVAMAKAQDARQWHVEAKVTPAADGARLDLIARDAAGGLIDGMEASAVFERPTDRRLDRSVALVADSAGRFHGNAAVAPGQWDLVIELTRQGVVEGIHLEGPWLSVACCGAHDPDLLRDPGPAEVAALVAAAGPALKMVTLAPERPGALDAVRQLVAAGVVVAIGHTAASFEVTRAAIDAGARVATHLGNAMAPLHQRRPGPILALLEDRRVVCEVIADGHHLHPAFAGHLVARAGAPRTALITDAVVPGGRGRGATEGRDGAVWLCGRDVLAGSALTMDAAFEAATTALGLTVPDAVRVTSTTAAAVLGRGDLGHLGPGARADLVVLGPRGASSVLARGHWVDTTPG